MNAIKFIQQHGVDKAREVVEGAPKGAELFHTNTYIKNAHSEGRTDHFARWSDGFKGWVNASADREFIDESIVLEELKRLVESVDLVNCNGGWNGTKNTITLFQSSLDLGLYHGVDGVDAEVEIPRLKQAIADYEAIYSFDIEKREFELGLAPDSDYVKGGEHV